MVSNLIIPLSKEDKKIISKRAKALKISMAGYCRILIFQNINLNCIGSNPSAQDLIDDSQQEESSE